MSFVDEIEITIEAGKGGPGCVSFHREKFVPKGGPDGGDGGKGGDIYFVADETLSNLNNFLSQKYFKAENGQPGRGQKQHGKDGKDLIIRVPVGTVILDSDSREILGELDTPGKKILIAKGGKGGLGNVHFASSVNQTPEYAQPGLPGESKKIILNLKLIADVGFVGFPNAGKSTLLKALTSNNPKIADYPFTTLNPNLGVLFYTTEDLLERRILLADIPGIIEGASKGVGLGISFLKHIERVNVIIYILDINSLQLAKEYKTLQLELIEYSPELLKKKSIIVFNKIDLLNYEEEFIQMIYEDFCREVEFFQKNIREIPVFFISANDAIQNKEQLKPLMEQLIKFFPLPTYAEILIHKRVV